MKMNAKQLRKDLNLTDKEFETRYPGLNKETVRDLTNEELDKIAGGYASKVSYLKSKDIFT